MAVTDVLDYTPSHSFNTIQFSSETVNVIVTSLLTTLIAANIGSITSKLVSLTHPDTFNYNAWLRSYIFANSDDPVRISSWLFRNYVYRDVNWIRTPHHLHVKRLILPMLARCFILLTTISSIVIAIPQQRQTSGCGDVDYSLRWDTSRIELSSEVNGICENIPLTSQLGVVTSTASFCTETQRIVGRLSIEDSAPAPSASPSASPTPSSSQTPIPSGAMVAPSMSPHAAMSISAEPSPCPSPEPPKQTIINATRSNADARFDFMVANLTSEWAMSFRIEWRRNDEKDVLFLSDVASLDLPGFMDIASRALHDANSTIDCPFLDTNRTITSMSRLYDCDSDAVNLFLQLKLYVKSALVWQPQITKQTRLKRAHQQLSQFTQECPVSVLVSIPILNVLPLLVLLCVSFICNVLITRALSAHGNALDSAFHVIKDALGHDTTSNPLEESETHNEISEVRLRKWICEEGDGGHVSFIGREGDCAVKQFDESLVVGRCAKTYAELRATIQRS